MMNPDKHKLLAVDDSTANLLAIRAVFDKDEYEIIEAKSGAEALTKLQENEDIAVILLDVQMPGMDGYETAIKIKRMAPFRETPIIFITAVYNEEPHIQKGYDVGAIDYFTKPFDPEILRVKVAIYSTGRQREILLREREKRMAITNEALSAGQRLTGILDSLPVGVLIADTEGKICQINQGISQVLCIVNLDEDANFGEVLTWWNDNERSLRRVGGPLHRALSEGKTSPTELVRINCVDGMKKLVYVSASPLRGFSGQIVGAGIIIQDITGDRKMEHEIEDRISNLLSGGTDVERSIPTDA